MKTPLPRRFLLTWAMLVCIFTAAHAQQEAEKPAVKEKKRKHFDASTVVMFTPIYTAQFPFGNMRDRFGFNSLFGFQVGYKMKKNWIIAAEGNFLFGTQLKENYVLDNISTATGHFVSQNNDLIRVEAREQGFSLKLSVGKVIPFSEKYPDAGLLLMTGVGFLQHKIGIDVNQNSLPQLSTTYRKGYDRMCNGPVISQFVGGVFMARRKFWSAYAGVQFDIAFTENRRPFDFYLARKLEEKRIDMFLGIKVGWIIPIFIKASEQEYYE